mgnify:FL=1
MLSVDDSAVIVHLYLSFQLIQCCYCAFISVLSVDDSAIIDVVRLLLDAGADVNAGKRTALHSAVLANTGKSDSSTDLEEYLVSRASKVFARDESQRLPLHYAFVSQAE